MLIRLAKNKVTQSHTLKTRIGQALVRPTANIMSGNLQVRASSAMELSGLQMNNKMFITKSVLEKQVAIMKDENIPKTLKASDEYVYRHMGNSAGSTKKILDFLGVASVEELMDQVVPKSIRLTDENRFKHNGKELEGIDSETLMLERMRQLADNNVINKSFIGQGYYGTNTPSVIRRNVLENPRWYTPYPPYQAEIAQGRLESLLNF